MSLVDGTPARMLHAERPGAAPPIEVPLWLSTFGPRVPTGGRAGHGIIGPAHPTLPSATIVSGTVLDPGEDRGSVRVAEAIGPWRVVDWHAAYHAGGAAAVDAMPGGREWREALEALAPEGERHLLTFEGHVTQLPDRDRRLLDHIDRKTLVGDDESKYAARFRGFAEKGFAEVIYTSSGPTSLASCALSRRRTPGGECAPTARSSRKSRHGGTFDESG